MAFVRHSDTASTRGSHAGPSLGPWIDGREHRDGRDVEDTIDPAHGRGWASVARAAPEDVERAVAAAHAAFHRPAWATLSPTQRGELLFELARLIRRDAERLAVEETAEVGKPLWQTRGEVAAAAQWFSYYGGAADKVEGSSIDLSATRHGRTSHRPLGVVAILSPFNGPFALTSWKLAPALATGNTVVIKPSPDTPVTPLRLGQLASEAGFPAGVVNVLPGGSDVGAQLVSHPDVAAVAFTGSTDVGRRIAATAAGTFKRTLIEAGGKSPFVVFADADLDLAVPAAVAGIFGASGQSCVANSRMVVHSSVHDEFVQRLSDRARRLRIGDPMDDRTHMGPLSSRRQLDRVAAYVELAEQDGLDVIAPPLSDDLDAEGYYHRPTLVVGADNAMRISQEEIFGPVGVVLPFDDDDEAVQIANGTEFGLAAGVWTRDVSRAHRVANRLEAGTVWINTYRAMHWTLPFGGYKQSGLGRENGLEAMREFTQLQTQVVDYGTPTADPYAG
jgi:aldehyde dehydrogenase (NAD+)